jgi:hypothetical protein
MQFTKKVGNAETSVTAANLRRLTSQKSEDLNYTAAEAWDLTFAVFILLSDPHNFLQK